MGQLKKEFPDIFHHLHPVRNNGMLHTEITSKSSKQLWWICNANPQISHFFRQKVVNMTKHKVFRCSVCCSIGGKRPDLISHWDYEKYVMKPSKIGATIKTLYDSVSKKEKFYWKCPRGHVERLPLSIAAKNQRKNICKKCNSILYTHPQHAECYASQNALDILDISAGLKRKVYWTCSEGHLDLVSVNERVREGVGCRICSGKKIVAGINSLADFNPNLLKEWDWEKNDQLGISPYDIGPGFNSKKVFWLCNKHGSYSATIGNRNHRTNPTGCGKCRPQSSRNEIRIFTELDYLFNHVEHRKKINNTEIDIYLPDLRIGIQFDGWYWHRNAHQKDKKQRELLADCGIKLIRFRERPLDPTDPTDLFVMKNSLISFEDILMLVKAVIKINGTQLDPVIYKKIEDYVNAGGFAATKQYTKILTSSFKIPKATSLEGLYPEIAREWDYELNHPVTPRMITPGIKGDVNGENYFWKCSKKTEHESYQMPVYSRTGRERQGCPRCAGRVVTTENNLRHMFPKLAEMFDRANNKIEGERICSNEIMPKSGRKFNWLCDAGHEIRDKSPDQMSKAKYFYGCRKCYETAIEKGEIKVGNHKYDNSEVIRLYKIHNNLSKVSRIIGCSPSTVSNILKKELQI